MLCLSVVFRRKQWADNEKLPFPIVYLPLELTKSDPEAGPIYRQQTVLGRVSDSRGFGNALPRSTICIPVFPCIPLKPSTLPNLSSGLEIAAVERTGQQFDAGFLPAGYRHYLFFADRNLVFGVVLLPVFQIGGCVCDRIGPSRSRRPGCDGPHSRTTANRAAGAFLALALFGFWSYRKYLSAVIGKAFGEKEFKDVPDENEPVSYRVCRVRVPFGVCLAVRVRDCGRHGVVASAHVFRLVLSLFATTFSRVRAEAGLPWGFGPSPSIRTAF